MMIKKFFAHELAKVMGDNDGSGGGESGDVTGSSST